MSADSQYVTARDYYFWALQEGRLNLPGRPPSGTVALPNEALSDQQMLARSLLGLICGLALALWD
jgi:hypothetical protein